MTTVPFFSNHFLFLKEVLLLCLFQLIMNNGIEKKSTMPFTDICTV